MSSIANFDRTTAKYEPGNFFNCPEAIIDELMMTRGEKLAALGRWQQETSHALTLRTAGSTSNDAAELTERLARIQAAMEQLKKPENAIPEHPIDDLT
jgi:hypothetical protein